MSRSRHLYVKTGSVWNPRPHADRRKCVRALPPRVTMSGTRSVTDVVRCELEPRSEVHSMPMIADSIPAQRQSELSAGPVRDFQSFGAGIRVDEATRVAHGAGPVDALRRGTQLTPGLAQPQTHVHTGTNRADGRTSELGKACRVLGYWRDGTGDYWHSLLSRRPSSQPSPPLRPVPRPRPHRWPGTCLGIRRSPTPAVASSPGTSRNRDSATTRYSGSAGTSWRTGWRIKPAPGSRPT